MLPVLLASGALAAVLALGAYSLLRRRITIADFPELPAPKPEEGQG